MVEIERQKKAIELVQEFLQAGLEIPFSPVVGTKLIELSGKPVETIDINQLVKLLETDAGFASKMLQLANSTYFAGVEKIVSLRRAIIQVGIEEAINFMQMAYYRTVLPEIPSLDGYFSDQDYWARSWATALAGKILGHPRAGGQVLPGELYIAGMLHGIGKIVLVFNRPVDVSKLLKKSQDFHQPFEDVQLEFFGTTDADIACELLTFWQLPDHICQAVKYMHRPEEAPADIQEFSGLLQLAESIAGITKDDDNNQEVSAEVERSWVVAESSLAVAEPLLLKEFINDIQSALQRKGDLFSVEDEENSELEEESPLPDVESETVSQPLGIFQRFLQWLRSFFV